MTMGHGEIESLLGAHALDAVTAAEAALVEDHVRGCRRCREELEAHRAVARRLVRALPDVEPPPHLWEATLAAVRATKDEHAVPVLLIPRTTQRWQRIAQVAAALLLVVGVAAATVQLRSGAADDPATVLALRGADRAVVADVRVTGDEVTLRDVELPPLPPGTTYQAWQISSGGVRSIGTFRPEDRAVSLAALVGDDVGTIAITTEPEGGSPQPTSEPLATTAR